MTKAMGLGGVLGPLRELFGRGTSAGTTDDQLLARYAATGDAAAFEALVRRHGPMVVATCRAVLRDESDAEDAFQATFLVLAKKARQIHAGAALGGWLHRVAYRAAVQTNVRARRRRREEREAGLMAIRDQAVTDDVEDLRGLLHEEVDQLPERLRLPVVLRDLQGLSYAEAAARLGLSEPALRTRLARGRERLRRRLASRGFTACVISSALTVHLSSTFAAVPASWLKAAVASAAGAAAPAGVVAIAEILIGGMLMARLKLIACVILGATVVLATGAGLVAGLQAPPTSEPVAVEPPPVLEKKKKEVQPKADTQEETFEVRGVVVDPDGRPAPGAVVWSHLTEDGKPVKMVAGADGRFTIKKKKKLLALAGSTVSYLSMFSWLTAAEPGFGVGLLDPSTRKDPYADQVVRLVAEGTPLEGRVLDLEGRPVAGARVEVHRIWYDSKSPGDLSPWLDKVRSGAVRGIWQDLINLVVDLEATTDADGRFRISSVGHDRVAELLVVGPTIAHTRAFVLTRDEPEIRTVDKAMMSPEPLIVLSPRFEIVAPPTRPIEGAIRDAETGEPIAGLELGGMVFEENSFLYTDGVKAETDAQGRFRLLGLGHAPAYRLKIIPPEGSPYLRSSRKVEASGATGPVAFDFAMKPGAIVRGRVLEKGTGRPAVGNVEVVAFDDTPRDDYPGAFSGNTSSVPLDEDGRFEIAALPGRGLLLVRGDDVLYRYARDFESIPGYVQNGERGYFNTIPFTTSPWGYHAVVEIHPGHEADSEPIEIGLDLGGTVKLRAVDPDGQPIDDATVKGLGELFSTSPMPITKSEFDVHGLDPSSPRRVVVTQEARKLIGSVCLKGDEQGVIEVKLQPWGTLVGRVVDEEGNPMTNIRLGSPTGNANKSPEDSDIIPGTDWNAGLILPDDGRFHLEGLVPGLKYSASASATRFVGGVLFRDAIPRSGEVVDLGDLKLAPFEKGD